MQARSKVSTFNVRDRYLQMQPTEGLDTDQTPPRPKIATLGRQVSHLMTLTTTATMSRSLQHRLERPRYPTRGAMKRLLAFQLALDIRETTYVLSVWTTMIEQTIGARRQN